MLIGIDLDDTLADTMPSFLLFCNERRNTVYTKAGLERLDYADLMGCAIEQAFLGFQEFCMSSYAKTIKPYSGAVEAIERLRDQHQIIIITARSAGALAKLTQDWVKNYFADLPLNVHFVNNYSQGIFRARKSEFCIKLGVDLMIDDSLEHAIDCSQAGIDVVLFDQPWNRFGAPEGISRVQSWDEIGKVVSSKN